MKKLLSLILAAVLIPALAAPALALEISAWDGGAVELPDDAELVFEVDGDAPGSYLPGGVHLISLEDDYYDVDVDDLEIMDPEDIDISLIPDGDWNDIIELPEPEPTLTLVVNGKAMTTRLTVEDWVTYLDAADARAIFGVANVPVSRGPVPLRQVAEAAGWDVVWYDGGWSRAQEICLWNKEAVLEPLRAKFAPFQDCLKTLLTLVQQELGTAAPKKYTGMLNGKLVRFSTLDGDREGTFQIKEEAVWRDGVVDAAVTLDLSGIVDLFGDGELTSLYQLTGAKRGEIKKAAAGIKCEIVFDGKTGGLAVKWSEPSGVIPVTGWNIVYLPGFNGDVSALTELDIGGMLYETVLEQSKSAGGTRAKEELDRSTAILAAFVGSDRFRTSGDGWSLSLATEQVNAALDRLMADELGVKSWSAPTYKKCDLTFHMDKRGKMDLNAHIRPDVDGIAQTAALLDEASAVPDVEVVIRTRGDLTRGEEVVDLHWNNHGRMHLTGEFAADAADTFPRQMAQLERQNVTAGGWQ